MRWAKFTDPHIILARWGKHIFQIMNAPRVHNFRQPEKHTEEERVPEASAFVLRI